MAETCAVTPVDVAPVDVTEQYIIDLVHLCHTPDLVKKDESPNGNTIYHIHNDGEITYQKGGWAYLQRSVFTEACQCGITIPPQNFPYCKREGSPQHYGYAVVTRENAYKIRNLMIQLKEKLNPKN